MYLKPKAKILTKINTYVKKTFSMYFGKKIDQYTNKLKQTRNQSL